MEMDCIEKRIWGKFPTGRPAIPFYIMLLILATMAWTSIADAYVLRGTVTNNSGKTGRVYLAIDHYADNGTSIDSSGDFTISGVPSGTYTITAVMDTGGDGKLFASDPRGTSASFTVASVDKSGIAITISNPATLTPPTPSWLKVYPGDCRVGCRWDIKTDNSSHLPIADHYNFYWSTSPDVSPANTSGGGSRPGVPDPGYDGFYISGLNNGTTLYFVVTAVVNGVEGLPSPISGPVTIGLPTSGGVAVQGTVSLSGFTPTGPLCLGLWGIDSGKLFMKCFTSPTSVQPFQFNNVPDGYYISIASVDMNNNGIEDIGDFSVGSFPGTSPEILVQGAPVSGVAIHIPGKSNDAGVFTEFNYPNNYSLFFMARNTRKLITNMTATSGPNINQPIDIQRDTWYEYWGFGLPGRPVVGSAYTLNLRYSDNSNETQSVAISDILDGYATPVSPSGSTSTLTPLMTWSAPSPAPIQIPFRYKIEVLTASGTTVWENDMVPSNRTYSVYNEDGTATPLVSGTQYYWQVSVRDQNANRSNGPKVYFTPTATPAKQLTVVSRNPASAVSIAVSPNDKNNRSNGSSPFTRFYDTGTTVTLTAPATAGGNNFNNWSGCDSFSGTLCTVKLSSDKTVSAIYSFLPPPPAGIISATGTGQVSLNWSSVPGATSYNLYYSTTPGVTKTTGTKIANVTNSYTVPSLTNGTPYYFVVTSVNANGEGAESAMVGAVPGMPNAYTLGDLAGTWEGHSLESPGPWWSRGTFHIASDGSFTTTNNMGSDGPSSPNSGSFSISSEGIVTMPSYTSLRCFMDSGRTVIVGTVTNNNGVEMFILTKKADSYSLADLAGTWQANGLETPGPWWVRRTLVIASDGSFTSTGDISSSGPKSPISGTFSLTSDGVMMLPLLNPTLRSTIDAGKSVAVSNDTTVEGTEMGISLKKANSYSQSDLAGTWGFSYLSAGASNVWARSVFSIGTDGSFSINEEVSDGTSRTASGKWHITSTGVITIENYPSVECAMDAGKTVISCSSADSHDGISGKLIVMVKLGSVPRNITGRWEQVFTQGDPIGVSGLLLTQSGNNVYSTGTINGYFDSGKFTGSALCSNPPIPCDFEFFISSDGKALDGVVTTHYQGGDTSLPFIFYWKSDDPHNPDLSVPTVTATYPSANQTGIQRQNLVISVTWSKPVHGWDLLLVGNIGGVSQTIHANDLVDDSKLSYNPLTKTITMPLWPNIILDPNTTYTVILDEGGVDWNDPYGIPAWTSTGNAYSFTFTTGNSLVPEKNLAVTLSGSGTGSINSPPSGPIACTWPPQEGTCSTTQPVNTSLTLIANPGNDSSFEGWGEACSSCDKQLSCLLSFDIDKVCTAAFKVLPLVRIAGPAFYGSIIKAYAQLTNGTPAIMQAQAVELTENVDLDKSIPLTVLGGYDSVFNAIKGFTILHGILNISKGSLIVDRLIVQ